MERSRILKAIEIAAELGLLATVLGTAFTRNVKEYAHLSEGHECALCGGEKKLQVHHMCFQSIAKKHSVSREIYDHPANARVLCDNCHTDLHKQYNNITEAEEVVLVRQLYRAVINFHLSEANARQVIATHNQFAEEQGSRAIYLHELENSQEVMRLAQEESVAFEQRMMASESEHHRTPPRALKTGRRLSFKPVYRQEAPSLGGSMD